MFFDLVFEVSCITFLELFFFSNLAVPFSERVYGTINVVFVALFVHLSVLLLALSDVYLHFQDVVSLFCISEPLVQSFEFIFECLSFCALELLVHVLYCVNLTSGVHVWYDGALLLVKDLCVLLSSVFENLVVVELVLFDCVLELACVGSFFLPFYFFDVFSAFDLFFVVILEGLFLPFFESTFFFSNSFSVKFVFEGLPIENVFVLLHKHGLLICFVVKAELIIHHDLLCSFPIISDSFKFLLFESDIIIRWVIFDHLDHDLIEIQISLFYFYLIAEPQVQLYILMLN